jgi:hypothetical protein
LSFRTNSRGNVYPVDNKNILKFDPKTKRFNMFSDGTNESDNQKRKHLEKFANITKKGIFGATNKIKQKNQERAGQKESNHKELNLRITGIANSKEPTNMKIQYLQRLLNEKSKDMDKPMLQTVQNELARLYNLQGTSQDITEPEIQDDYEPENDDTDKSQNNKKHMTPNEVFSQGL